MQKVLSFLLLVLTATRGEAVPGTVIDHSPASSGLYIGSPSIVILTNGSYLVSHDLFGPNSAEFESPKTLIFASNDRGATWSKIATLESLFWAGLFEHRGQVYVMGTDKHHGRILIRRSRDQGRSWTEATDSNHGLLTERANYHTAPTPVIEQNGRLWRAFEDASGGTQWGMRYLPMMLSVAADADLLVATNWTFSSSVSRDPNWLENGGFNAWLEGNAVAAPNGAIVNILRVDTAAFPEKAAMLNVSADGKKLTFDPASGIVDFPGGAKKFTIRLDRVSGAWWSLANAVPKGYEAGVKPSSIRNTLALVRSKNLRNWEVQRVVLEHTDSKTHAFQYADWQFDGEDIVAVVRTAFDDDEGGAHNAHDANYLTFHRVTAFRK